MTDRKGGRLWPLIRPRTWALILGGVVLVALLVTIVLTTRPRHTDARQAAAKLSSQVEDVLTTVGGSWTDETRSKPWSPARARGDVPVVCASDRSLHQYEEVANGPGYPHPDAVAATLAKHWKALGYVTDQVDGLGVSATEKSGFHLTFDASSILSEVTASSDCF